MNFKKALLKRFFCICGFFEFGVHCDVCVLSGD